MYLLLLGFHYGRYTLFALNDVKIPCTAQLYCCVRADLIQHVVISLPNNLRPRPYVTQCPTMCTRMVCATGVHEVRSGVRDDPVTPPLLQLRQGVLAGALQPAGAITSPWLRAGGV